jgi:hypothetical protein
LTSPPHDRRADAQDSAVKSQPTQAFSAQQCSPFRSENRHKLGAAGCAANINAGNTMFVQAAVGTVAAAFHRNRIHERLYPEMLCLWIGADTAIFNRSILSRQDWHAFWAHVNWNQLGKACG